MKMQSAAYTNPFLHIWIQNLLPNSYALFSKSADMELHAGTGIPPIPRKDHVKRVIPSWNNEKPPREINFLARRGPLSLVSTTEELLDRKVAAPV
jgi:hypothetical protein